jgi:hypothetical protein
LSQLADAVVVPVSLVKGAQAEIDVTDSAASAIAEMIRILTSLRHHEMEISLSNAEYRLDRWKARFDRSYRRSVSSMGACTSNAKRNRTSTANIPIDISHRNNLWNRSIA